MRGRGERHVLVRAEVVDQLVGGGQDVAGPSRVAGHLTAGGVVGPVLGRVDGRRERSAGRHREVDRARHEPAVVLDAYLRNHIVDTIRDCLLGIGVDRFDAALLSAAQKQFAEQLDGRSNLPAVLWQNGLLGFTGRRDGQEATYFYRMGGINDLHPPTTEGEYVLHACLIDAVGVRSLGPVPVSQHW